MALLWLSSKAGSGLGLLTRAALLLAAAVLHLLGLWLKWSTSMRRWVVGGILIIWLAHGAAFTLKLGNSQRSAIAVSNTQALFEPRDGSTTPIHRHCRN